MLRQLAEQEIDIFFHVQSFQKLHSIVFTSIAQPSVSFIQISTEVVILPLQREGEGCEEIVCFFIERISLAGENILR